MALLFALIITITLVESKVYERCELARELKHTHEFPAEQIPTWVCIVKHESVFNTSAVNPGSGDHGLFQISELFWCSPPGNGYACNAPCSAFEDDDITDDIACIRRIFREHAYLSGDGFNAWAVYPRYCKGDVAKYVEGCFDNEIDNNINPSPPDDEDDVYEFPPLPTTPKTVSTRLQYQITTPKPTKLQNPVTTPKPTSSKPVKELKTKVFKAPYTFKSGSELNQVVPKTSVFSSTTPKTYLTRKATTLKPLAIVFENVHSDRKREQKFFEDNTKAEYSFLWKANGFRLVRN